MSYRTYKYNIRTLAGIVNLEQDWADHDHQLLAIWHDGVVDELMSYDEYKAARGAGRLEGTWARLTFCEDEGWADLAAYYADLGIDPATIGE